MLRYILVFVLGYCIGSFPTAYLFVKRRKKVDIRVAGSGNVGGMNAFEVTNSIHLGAVIVVIDSLKGVMAVVLTGLVFGWDFLPMSVSGLSAIVGHNYSVWIGFHGGRGLAAAAGMMLVLGWIIVVVWCTAWAIMYAYSRNLHLSSIIATFTMPVVAAVAPGSVSRLFLWNGESSLNFFLVVLSLSVLLFISHLEPLKAIMSSHHKPTDTHGSV